MRGRHGIGRPSRPVLLLLTALGAAALALLWIRLTDSPTPRERLEELRQELVILRAAADSCRDALAAEEASFQSYRAELDSLRARVRAYEALDPRGVPADSYDAYLALFEEYNRGVLRWDAVSETLQAHWRECRGIAETHNVVADSARRWADSLGLPALTPLPR